MMKYKNGYIGLVVLAILISVIAFAVPTEKTASFWIAYISMMIWFMKSESTFQISKN